MIMNLDDIKDEQVYCRTCNCVRNVEFIGNQSDGEEIIFSLYNCPICHNTIAYNYTEYYRKFIEGDK